MDYQKEQKEINAQLEEINTKLNKSLCNKEESLIRFKGNVSEYLDYKELTLEMINNLIDHIIIGHPKIVDGEKVRTIEIVYRFIN